jgi:hypothetical protein
MYAETWRSLRRRAWLSSAEPQQEPRNQEQRSVNDTFTES